MNAPLKLALADLVAAWREAKDAEVRANQQRVALETMIAAELPPDDPESSVKADVNGYRVKVQYKVTRSVDSDALTAMWSNLSEKAQACFRWKADVKLGELRKVQEFLPDDYARIARCIEAKPAKPSVTIEEIAA